jgi:hypothetical protein
MDRLEAMSYLAASAEAGSFSAAGRQLDVPLPTISRKLADLEAHVKTQLLVRSTRKLSLTEAGMAYIAACRRILEQVNEAESKASGVPRGTLTMGEPSELLRCSPTSTTAWPCPTAYCSPSQRQREDTIRAWASTSENGTRRPGGCCRYRRPLPSTATDASGTPSWSPISGADRDSRGGATARAGELSQPQRVQPGAGTPPARPSPCRSGRAKPSMNAVTLFAAISHGFNTVPPIAVR